MTFMTGSSTRRALVLVVGAASAGVHAGLAPEHLHEWAPLGASFVVAAAALSSGVAALAVWPGDMRPLYALAALFAALAVSYAATRLIALPPLDPDREAPDALGVATTAAEVAGVVIALRLAFHRQGGNT
jgi:hypothetical protein